MNATLNVVPDTLFTYYTNKPLVSTYVSLVSTDPVSPQFLQLNVSEYGVSEATVTVEWTYPDDGPEVDNYTVSLSVGESQTTAELMVIFVVPYDHIFNGSIVATNHIGTSSPATFEGLDVTSLAHTQCVSISS